MNIFEPGNVPHNFFTEHGQTFKRYGYIDSENADTLGYAKQASIGCFIYLEKNYMHARHVQGRVPYKASVSAITIAFNAAEVKKLRCAPNFKNNNFQFKAEIVFELKHYYFQTLHKAIRFLPKPIIKRLTPTREMLKQARRYYNQQLKPLDASPITIDDMQMKALRAILGSNRAGFPVLVAGPFGTGKTRLLARAAHDILIQDPNSRVLICAYQHNSVNTFMEYFGDILLHTNSFNMVRVLPDGMHRVSSMVKYENFITYLSNLTEETLLNCRLVITTFSTSIKLYQKIPGENKREFFTDILLDEGAQTREPETIAPLSLAWKFTRIIIAGDHCQVNIIITKIMMVLGIITPNTTLHFYANFQHDNQVDFPVIITHSIS